MGYIIKSHRLFIVFKDFATKYIREETAFLCLKALIPAQCGVMISLHVGENLFGRGLHNPDPTMMYYSWCSKTPFTFDMVCDSEIQKTSVVVTLALSAVDLIVHAILLVMPKLTKCGIEHSSLYDQSIKLLYTFGYISFVIR